MWTEKEIRTTAGLVQRAYAVDAETALELARRAAEPALVNEHWKVALIRETMATRAQRNRQRLVPAIRGLSNLLLGLANLIDPARRKY
jgi:hypothetical protein